MHGEAEEDGDVEGHVEGDEGDEQPASLDDRGRLKLHLVVGEDEERVDGQQDHELVENFLRVGEFYEVRMLGCDE